MSSIVANTPVDTSRPSLGRRVLNLPNLFSLSIALFLVYFLIAGFDFDSRETWERLTGSNLAWYALAFGCYYLVFPIRGLRWRFLLEGAGCEGGVGFRRLPILRLAEISFLGWFVNTITVFRMGYFYRCHLLSRQIKSSLALVAGSLFGERILDTVVTFALLLVAALGLLSTSAASVVGPVLLGTFLASLVLAGAAIAMTLAGRNPAGMLPTRLRPGYSSFRHGTLKGFRRWPWLGILSIAIWACEVARLLLVIEALDLSVDLPLVMFVALAVSLITSFPITPGGLGLAEAGLTGLLTTALSWEEAVSVALLDRSVNYLSVLVFGGALFLARSLRGWDTSDRTQPMKILPSL
ncbi:MAG: YbhN family protein [Dehalococcoidia bacterium]